MVISTADKTNRLKPLMGVAALAIIVGTLIAIFNRPQHEAKPGLVPEAISPVMLISAYGMMDGGSKVVHLRDTTGRDFEFKLKRCDVPSPGENCNRLIVFDSKTGDSRLVEVHSIEEQRLKNALTAALQQWLHVDSNEPTSPADTQDLAYARQTLTFFADIGDEQ